MFDQIFFEGLPDLLSRYQRRWSTKLTVRVITDDGQFEVVSVLESRTQAVVLLYYAQDLSVDLGPGERDDPLGGKAWPAVVLPYDRIQSVHLIPARPSEGEDLGFRG